MIDDATKTFVSIADRKWFIRALEIFPGFVTWTFLISPFVLSIFYPVLVAYFIIAFDLYWLIKAFRLSSFLVRGYNKLHVAQKVDWSERLSWLKDPSSALGKAEAKLKKLLTHHPTVARRFHFGSTDSRYRLDYKNLVDNIQQLRNLQSRHATILTPDSLYNVVILATYNESIDILEPSVQALLATDYNHKQIILIIAYEERGGATTEQNAKALIEKYGSKFYYAEAIKHPDGITGEHKGKGANISYAGRKVADFIASRDIDPEHVIVTTFDSDHRADRQYFSHLSFVYASDPNRVHKSFQPVPMFYNNIWDAPAPMRVIATSNSFWLIMETMRPHRLRNFAAHAQSLRALIETDYWSVTSPVEDGHQYWRSYFKFDGDHHVVPVYVPVYQDAVLADTYLKTFRAQYLQMRRWAYGISDFPYVVRQAIKNPRIRLRSKLLQIFRLFEGHFSWATAALIISFVAWLPLLLNQEFSNQILAHQLPIIASRLMNISMVGLIITVAISMISLPPRPARYGRHRNIVMVFQWALLPLTGIIFGSFAAIDSQTRLMFGRYLEFYVTDKSIKKP